MSLSSSLVYWHYCCKYLQPNMAPCYKISLGWVIPGASLVAQRIKRLPAMQETQVRSLGWEDPLEKEMATHSSVLAWRIPGTAKPGGLPSLGSHTVEHNWSDLAAAAAAGGQKDSSRRNAGRRGEYCRRRWSRRNRGTRRGKEDALGVCVKALE